MKPFSVFVAAAIAVFSLIVTSTTSDLAADRSALIALRSSVGGRSLLWNVSQATPCGWVGVNCSSNRVSELRLPGMALTGPIPAGTIGNLTQLHTLSLRFNSLSGPLPPDLNSLTNLRNLYLQNNFLSGPILDSLFSLPGLVRLNLADNNFSGPFSPSFNNLTRLATLYLENNRLTGSIPDLSLSLVQFNVSNNQLAGEVPQRFSGFPASVFMGNSLCGRPLPACNGTSSGKGKKKLSGGAIAGIVIGSVVGLLLIAFILILCCRKKRGDKEVKSRDGGVIKQVGMDIPQDKSVESKGSFRVGYGPGRGGKEKENAGGVGGKCLVFFGKMDTTFDLEDLLRASAEVLGKGAIGTTYKAMLELGMTVAVKRLKDVNVPDKEFKEAMEEVGKMNHENLVPLRAYYYSRDEKLLVFDYIPMGSLSALLHGNKGAGRTPLNWETRSLIARGAARGIAYLHSQGAAVSHGNIKSSNVLLTKSYDARVSDFGLAQLVGPTAAPNRVAGYRAPEVTDPHKVSQKADVYSFGVLLLELLTGKVPSQPASNEEGVDLPRWIQSVVREEWTAEVFDLELLRYQNVEDDMVELLQLAIDCTAQYPDKRPSMAEVRSRIEDLCHTTSQQAQDPQNDIVDAD